MGKITRLAPDLANQIAAGEVVVLLGPSGSGKSTPLNIMGGLDQASSGRLFFKNLELTSLDDRALTTYRRQHVGFLAQGEIHIEYSDGCVVEHKAPQIVAIDPGHDGWVVGNEPVVLIEFDFERDTIRRLGMPDVHRHR